MFTEIYTYVVALVSNWAALIWGTSLIFDVGGLVLRKNQYLAFSERLDWYVAEETRVTVLRTLLVIGLLLAGFNAWNEQYQLAISKSPDTLATQVSEQNRTIRDLNSKVASLQSEQSKYLAQKWPALTNAQISDWAQKLSKYRVTLLLVYYADEHSEAFRDSLDEVFKRAGWPNPGALEAANNIGIAILAKQDDPAAATLASLLKPIAHSVDMQHGDETPKKIQLYIGKNPL